MNNKSLMNTLLYLIAMVGVLPAFIYLIAIATGQSVNDFRDITHVAFAPMIFALFFVFGAYLCLQLNDKAKIIVLLPLLAMAILPIMSIKDTDKMPSGAIVAFNSPEGCPKNWAFFESLQGRTIVGATLMGEDNKNEHHSLLTPRKLLTTGGSESHTLTVQEMPRHSHNFNYQEGSQKTIWYNRTDSGRTIKLLANFKKTKGTAMVGGGNAHNNMPPFIALYYCQKQ